MSPEDAPESAHLADESLFAIDSIVGVNDSRGRPHDRRDLDAFLLVKLAVRALI